MIARRHPRGSDVGPTLTHVTAVPGMRVRLTTSNARFAGAHGTVKEAGLTWALVEFDDGVSQLQHLPIHRLQVVLKELSGDQRALVEHATEDEAPQSEDNVSVNMLNPDAPWAL